MMTEFSQPIDLNLELTGKQKLVFEAVQKMVNGKKMFEEGKLELSTLIDNGGGGEEFKPRKQKKKGTSAGFSAFRKEKRTDDQIKKQVVKIIRNDGHASKGLLMKKLHVSQRKMDRILTELTDNGKIAENGMPGNKFGFVLKSKKKEKKHINGHKLKASGSGGSRLSGRGAAIDVTNEELVSKAKKFLETHDWVTKGRFIDAVNLSPGPGDRLIDHLKKEKVIKEVYKKNNPAHDKTNLRKFFVREMPYLELA